MSRNEIEQPARSADQHFAACGCHRKHAVIDVDEAELDEAFDEIGLREATIRHRVPQCAQGFPLVRRKFEVDVVAHVASSDSTVRGPLLAAPHEHHATTMSPE